jgi:hypothetical protein
MNKKHVPINDTLSLVARGQIQGTAEVEGMTSSATLRAIPLTVAGEPAGTLVLMRDVTDLRRREQALLGKDAAIREIHHRVKNNLQTVASLLRLQGRRLTDPAAQVAISEAGRRVATIAIVHDLLAHNPGGDVDFDEVVHRVVPLSAEASTTVAVKTSIDGIFGVLPSDIATTLALVLAELVSNAAEHAAVGREEVNIGISVQRSDLEVVVYVRDDGPGIELPVNQLGGLGLAIVTTLVADELGGAIDFTHVDSAQKNKGTEVKVQLPLARD